MIVITSLFLKLYSSSINVHVLMRDEKEGISCPGVSGSAGVTCHVHCNDNDLP